MMLSGMTHVAAPYIGATKAFASSFMFVGKGDRQKKVECDVVLIGAGIMSATLAAFLKELSPDLKIEVFERLDRVAGESSGAMNNAGTGHAALCELNYSPQESDGSVDISKAIKILESFEVSKQFWAYLLTQGYFSSPSSFINSVPHMSLVWGDDNIQYLLKRYEKMKATHLFKGMKYSEDSRQLSDWMPLIMRGSNLTRKMAASRNEMGTDVNFGALTRAIFGRLSENGVKVSLRHEVEDLRQDDDDYWHLDVKDIRTGKTRRVKTRFVFIGAGGGALPLLEKSLIPEAKGYGGFPVSGQFLYCKNRDLVEKHHAKVYGKASVGTPPMSVPHLDSRIIDGRKELLFGPYAGFSTRFLKEGSSLDLPLSVDIGNIKSLLGAGKDNVPLTKYLIGQVMQSHEDRINALREFIPDARAEDWDLTVAGQRVQVIKKGASRWGALEFGTEVVTAADGSIAALLGASPGASSSASIMLEVLNRCFKEQMQSAAWRAKLKQMIPSYGLHLADDAALTEKVRNLTHGILKLQKT